MLLWGRIYVVRSTAMQPKNSQFLILKLHMPPPQISRHILKIFCL